MSADGDNGCEECCGLRIQLEEKQRDLDAAIDQLADAEERLATAMGWAERWRAQADKNLKDFGSTCVELVDARHEIAELRNGIALLQQRLGARR